MPELLPCAPGTDVPRKTGVCEYCLRETTVYAEIDRRDQEARADA